MRGGEGEGGRERGGGREGEGERGREREREGKTKPDSTLSTLFEHTCIYKL